LPRVPTVGEIRDDRLPRSLDDLIDAARANPLAFEHVYHHYLDRVYASVRARVPGEADAAEVTQQIFVQALEALPRYRGDGSTFASWLFSIARSKVADFYRRQGATLSWDQIEDSVQLPAELPIDAGLLQHESLTRLRTLVAGLDSASYELLVLRFAGQLTVAEIARTIGKSEAATQRKLHRLIHSLKDLYHDDAQ
jgi:RNA polymerase sigma-70 factor (ECF subfamily)